MTTAGWRWARKTWLRLVVPFCVTVVLSTASSSAQQNVAGTWEWRGDRGWQRLTLALKVEKAALRGTVSMGAGPGDGPDLWEYLFSPVVFEITKGTIRGDTIAFEHKAYWSMNYGGEVRMTYTGRLNGDRLLLSRETFGTHLVPLNMRHHKFEVILHRVP